MHTRAKKLFQNTKGFSMFQKTSAQFRASDREAMKIGDLVVNVNSESGETGLFLGLAVDNGYEYSKVWWPQRCKIGTIQSSLLTLLK